MEDFVDDRLLGTISAARPTLKVAFKGNLLVRARRAGDALPAKTA